MWVKNTTTQRMKWAGVLWFISLLHITGVSGHTLYQWVIDSRMRFNYDPDPNNPLGVYNWPRTFTESCNGIHQSPVDIDTGRVRYGTRCPCPQMIYHSPFLRGEMKNNGHSPTFEPENSRDFQLSGVPFREGTYRMNDFHLHYGGVSGRSFELQGLRFRGSGIMSAGSEHTIDGLRFEGELHFVFYNSKYGGLEQAEDKKDGVVVIVILVQKIPGTMADTGESSRFSDFLQTNIPRIFPYLGNASTTVDMTTFFQRECEFYTYTGSTTTPTCHESVRWIILREPIRVTERAWFVLTGLQSRGDFNSRYGNYRTTQPINDRVVVANFERSRGARLPSPTGQAQTGIPGMAQVPARSNMGDIPARSQVSQSSDMPRMMEIPAVPSGTASQMSSTMPNRGTPPIPSMRDSLMQPAVPRMMASPRPDIMALAMPPTMPSVSSIMAPRMPEAPGIMQMRFPPAMPNVMSFRRMLPLTTMGQVSEMSPMSRMQMARVMGSMAGMTGMSGMARSSIPVPMVGRAGQQAMMRLMHAQMYYPEPPRMMVP